MSAVSCVCRPVMSERSRLIRRSTGGKGQLMLALGLLYPNQEINKKNLTEAHNMLPTMAKTL